MRGIESLIVALVIGVAVWLVFCGIAVATIMAINAVIHVVYDDLWVRLRKHRS